MGHSPWTWCSHQSKWSAISASFIGVRSASSPIDCPHLCSEAQV